MSEQQMEHQPMVDWAKDMQAAHARAFEVAKALPLQTLAKQRQSLDVALKVCAFIEQAGIDVGHEATLEGLLLAMNMVGGPDRAALVLRYCSTSRD